MKTRIHLAGRYGTSAKALIAEKAEFDRARQAEPATCPECGGSRLIAVHVCGSFRRGKSNDEECRRRCPRIERCLACADQPAPALALIADLYQRFADVGREQHWSAQSIESAAAEAERFRQLAKGAA